MIFMGGGGRIAPRKKPLIKLEHTNTHGTEKCPKMRCPDNEVS